jgi:hypothetical protein
LPSLKQPTNAAAWAGSIFVGGWLAAGPVYRPTERKPTVFDSGTEVEPGMPARPEPDPVDPVVVLLAVLYKKPPLFSRLVLCLSRACLGTKNDHF